jgi:archaeosine synthase beta-subunit
VSFTPEPFAGSSPEVDGWILRHRPAREPLDSFHPHAFFVEDERAESGEVVPVSTIFLTNRECPWRCLMCDLWKHTLTERVPVGAIPTQIDHALKQLPPARQIKLYNSGSFFDPGAIPPDDYPGIAGRVRGFERVIVESHPALVNESALRFRDLLAGRLEVAMGLETVHLEVLSRLNKRMTLKQFRRATDFLQQNAIALRVFILVKPPFLDEPSALEWARRSIDFAFDCGATVASLIPTRLGNGAMEALAAQGQFTPPKLATLEAALDYGIGLGRGRVFADLWDLEPFSTCKACFGARQERLCQIDLAQVFKPRIVCAECGAQ